MNKDVKIVITLISAVFLLTISLLIKNYTAYSKVHEITRNPLDSLEVLGERVYLRQEQRTYEIKANCDDLKSSEDQIVYYRLGENFKDSKVDLNIEVFSNNKLLKEEYKKVTHLNTILSIDIDNGENFEQIFNVKVTCETEEDKLD